MKKEEEEETHIYLEVGFLGWKIMAPINHVLPVSIVVRICECFVFWGNKSDKSLLDLC